MGYTTDFHGEFKLDRPLDPNHKTYLEKFSETRRMLRDAMKASKLADPVREAVNLPIGEDAGYFVGGRGFAGQDNDESVKNHNGNPANQPSLWCGWIPNEDGTAIEWNGVEKFYEYIDWIKYIIENFLKRWGYTLNGEVEWEGEDRDDFGKIVITDNTVKVQNGYRSYE